METRLFQNNKVIHGAAALVAPELPQAEYPSWLLNLFKYQVCPNFLGKGYQEFLSHFCIHLRTSSFVQQPELWSYPGTTGTISSPTTAAGCSKASCLRFAGMQGDYFIFGRIIIQWLSLRSEGRADHDAQSEAMLVPHRSPAGARGEDKFGQL